MTSELMTRMSDPEGDSDMVAFVGRVMLPSGEDWCAVTHSDLQSSAQLAQELLIRFGLRPGDAVCFVSRHSEAAQYAPIELAAQRLGLISCHVEATRFDAHRLTLYFAHLPIKALIGLTEEVMDNLGVELRQVLGPDTAVIAAVPLTTRLRTAGIDALTMTVVGPALAMECPARQGLHLDESIWTFTEQFGRIFGVAHGRPVEDSRDTGHMGTLVDGACECGLAGRRLCP